MKEGTEIKRSEERVNNYIDAQFFPGTSIFLAISDRLMGYIIADNIVKYKLSLESPGIPNTLSEENINLQAVNQDADHVPKCLAVGAKRFAVGWKRGGLVGIYEIHMDDPENIEILQTKIFNIEACSEIFSMEFNSNQEFLAVAGRRMLEGKKNTEPEVTECFIVNVPEIESIQTNALFPIKQLLDKGNPFGTIASVSLSTHRRTIATVGTDKAIRIWDFCDGKYKQTANTYYDGIMYDVSMHPLGIQLAIGTDDGVKIFYVLQEQARLAIEITGKECRTVQYSCGGHWLAAGLANQIFLIDPCTFETKFVLGPHKSIVKRLAWTPNDYYLVSSCRMGTSIVWSSRFEIYAADPLAQNSTDGSEPENKETKVVQQDKYEYIGENGEITGAAYDDEYDLLVTISINRVLEVRSDKATRKYLRYCFEEPLVPTCLLISKECHVLLVGTNVGYIRVFLWPLPPNKDSANYLEFHDFRIHAGEITGIKITIGDEYIVASSADGTISFLKISEFAEIVGDASTSVSPKHRRKLRKEQGAGGVRPKPHEAMDSLALIFKKEIQEKLTEIVRLEEEKKNAEELAIEKEGSIKKELEKEKILLRESQQKALEEEREAYKKLQQQYEADCKKAESQRALLLEEHQNNVKELDEKNKKEQRIAQDLNNENIELLEKQKADFRDEIDSIQTNLKNQLAQIEGSYKAKYNELKDQHSELLKKLKHDSTKFDTALENCEQEYEKEIENIKKTLFTEKKVAKVNNEELKTKTENADSDLKINKAEMEENREEKKRLGEKVEELRARKLQLETKLKEVEEQLKQREVIIHEKEKEIKNLKSSNTHLENFRFVLDHKIVSLKDEKMPMENRIKTFETQVNTMYQELEKEADTTHKLEEERKSIETKLNNALSQIHGQQVDLLSAKRKFELLQYDIINVLKQPIEKWANTLLKVYNAYFGKTDYLKIEAPESLVTKKIEPLKPVSIVKKKKNQDENGKVRDELLKQNEWISSELKFS